MTRVLSEVAPKKLDHEPMCILVRTAKPVEGQFDGQETACAPFSEPTESGRMHPISPFRGLEIGANYRNT